MILQPGITLRNSVGQNLFFDGWMKFDLHFLNVGMGYRSEKDLFVFAQVPVNDFTFSYTSENPVLSNHMMGNGHTFSIQWNFSPLN